MTSCLATATGVNDTSERLEATFGEAVQRDCHLNRKFGVAKAQDTLPDRILHEPLTEGPTSESVVELPRMHGQYYDLHER